MSYRMSLSEKQICRFCLVENESLFNLFENFEREIRMNLMASAVTSFEIYENDNLPKLLCCSCRDIIEAFYDFKRICKKSEFALQFYLKFGKFPNEAARNNSDNLANESRTDLKLPIENNDTSNPLCNAFPTLSGKLLEITPEKETESPSKTIKRRLDESNEFKAKRLRTNSPQDESSMEQNEESVLEQNTLGMEASKTEYVNLMDKEDTEKEIPVQLKVEEDIKMLDSSEINTKVQVEGPIDNPIKIENDSEKTDSVITEPSENSSNMKDHIQIQHEIIKVEPKLEIKNELDKAEFDYPTENPKEESIIPEKAEGLQQDKEVLTNELKTDPDNLSPKSDAESTSEDSTMEVDDLHLHLPNNQLESMGSKIETSEIIEKLVKNDMEAEIFRNFPIVSSSLNSLESVELKILDENSTEIFEPVHVEDKTVTFVPNEKPIQDMHSLKENNVDQDFLINFENNLNEMESCESEKSISDDCITINQNENALNFYSIKDDKLKVKSIDSPTNEIEMPEREYNQNEILNLPNQDVSQNLDQTDIKQNNDLENNINEDIEMEIQNIISDQENSEVTQDTKEVFAEKTNFSLMNNEGSGCNKNVCSKNTDISERSENILIKDSFNEIQEAFMEKGCLVDIPENDRNSNKSDSIASEISLQENICNETNIEEVDSHSDQGEKNTIQNQEFTEGCENRTELFVAKRNEIEPFNSEIEMFSNINEDCEMETADENIAITEDFEENEQGCESAEEEKLDSSMLEGLDCRSDQGEKNTIQNREFTEGCENRTELFVASGNEIDPFNSEIEIGLNINKNCEMETADKNIITDDFEENDQRCDSVVEEKKMDSSMLEGLDCPSDEEEFDIMFEVEESDEEDLDLSRNEKNTSANNSVFVCPYCGRTMNSKILWEAVHVKFCQPKIKDEINASVEEISNDSNNDENSDSDTEQKIFVLSPQQINQIPDTEVTPNKINQTVREMTPTKISPTIENRIIQQASPGQRGVVEERININKNQIEMLIAQGKLEIKDGKICLKDSN